MQLVVHARERISKLVRRKNLFKNDLHLGDRIDSW